MRVDGQGCALMQVGVFGVVVDKHNLHLPSAVFIARRLVGRANN